MSQKVSNVSPFMRLRSGRAFTPAGVKTRVEYQLDIEPDGNRKLVESGVTDVYASIQSFKESCSIENIVKRALAGDPYALAKQQGVYADSTLFPTDLISAHEAVKQAEAIYKGLPATVRAEFGGFNQFIQQFGSLEGIQGFLDKFNKKPSAVKVGSEDQSEHNAQNGGDSSAE